jgi:hypothetical protein
MSSSTALSVLGLIKKQNFSFLLAFLINIKGHSTDGKLPLFLE